MTNTYKNQKCDKNERKNCPKTISRIKTTARRLNRANICGCAGPKNWKYKLHEHKTFTVQNKNSFITNCSGRSEENGQVVRRMHKRRKSH